MRVLVQLLVLLHFVVSLNSASASTSRTIVSRPRGLLHGTVYYAGPSNGLVRVSGVSGDRSPLTVRGLCQFLSDDGWLVDIAVDDIGGATVRITHLVTNHEELFFAPRFRSPSLSPGGSYFAFLSGDTLIVRHLGSGKTRRVLGGFPYAVGWEGQLAVATGDHVALQPAGTEQWIEYVLPELVVGLAWERSELLIAACPNQVYEISQHGMNAAALPIGIGERVTWLGLEGITPLCFVRTIRSSINKTTLFRRREGTWRRGGVHKFDIQRPAFPERTYMWPLLPDETPPIGNSYGEYQYYGGTAYRHPGIDLLGDDNQPVYAVADGCVKAVLTTSGEWHWRVAVADAPVTERCRGWLYAHLDLSSIAVSVGDTVEAGDYLGNLVPWPVADFTHLHFARIEHEGETWDGQWLCPGSPHLLMNNVAEDDLPFFLEANGALVAFCEDNTSTYYDPDSLVGKVDLVAHVGDRIKSAWVVCAQEIRYHIYPSGRPEFPVVNDKLAVYFDHSIDVYQGGMTDQLLVPILFKNDSVCPTAGDYSYREFYHILSNSDGDSIPELNDEEGSFNTALLPDGEYVVRLHALDVAGNSATDSMTVTLANGNPDLVLHIQAAGNDLLLWWPRMKGATGYLVHRLLGPYSPGEGVFVAAVTDTFYVINDPQMSGNSGFYRVVATDAN